MKKQINFKSFGTKVFTVILSCILVPSLILTAISYNNSLKKSEISFNSELKLVSEGNASHVEAYFNEKIQLLKGIENEINSLYQKDQNSSNQEIKSRLVTLLKTFKDSDKVFDIYVGFPDNRASFGSEWEPDFSKWEATKRPWYIDAISANGNFVVTDPYVASDTGKLTVTISKKCDFGVLAADVQIAELKEFASSVKVSNYESGYIFITDSQGRFVAHKDFDFDVQDLKQTPKEKLILLDTIHNNALKDVSEEILSRKPIFLKAKVEGKDRLYYSQPIDGTNFVLVSVIEYDEIAQGLKKEQTMLFVILFVCSIIGILISFFVTKYITIIIKVLSNTAIAYSSGNFNIQIDKKILNRSDEFGTLANSLDQIKQKLGSLFEKIAEKSSQLAASSEELLASSEQNSAASDQVATASEKLAMGAVNTKKSSDSLKYDILTSFKELFAETSANLQNNKDRIEKIVESAKTTNSITKKVQDSQKLTLESNDVLSSEMNLLVNLCDSLKRITEMLSGIFTQTNLLALNASIEAARAGDAGRGFAVVAEEIRKLAEQSSNGSKQIEDIILSITQSVEKTSAMTISSSENIKNTSGLSEEMFSLISIIISQIESVSSITDLSISTFGQLEIKSVDMDNAIQDLNNSVASITDEISNVSATAEELSASAQETTNAAEDLAKTAEELQELTHI